MTAALTQHLINAEFTKNYFLFILENICENKNTIHCIVYSTLISIWPQEDADWSTNSGLFEINPSPLEARQ